MPKDFNYEIGSEQRLNENESLICDKYNIRIKTS